MEKSDTVILTGTIHFLPLTNMISTFQGPFDYSPVVIEGWNHALKGVYYCGTVVDGRVVNHYIGRAVGTAGIRGRLLDHLRDDYWPGVTHFWYRTCDTDQEASSLEVEAIGLHKPKYNTHHV